LEEPATAPDERPSKSQRKREMHARQDLGERLVRLGNDSLRRLALPEILRDAIDEARRIKGHEALRRQMQYIGRLMRDSDYAAIQSSYDTLLGGSRDAIALMHRCERLRDALIDDEAALPGFLAQHPGIDTQWLRAKVRAVRAERAAARPPRQARELYQWLHALLQGESAPAAATPATDAAAASDAEP
jgi:ribosome-associated protein